MISFLISVYKKENPNHFNLAMESIYNQTIKDFEVVLVVDGPLTNDLYNILHKWEKLFRERIKIIHLEENKGLANALNEGLRHCSFDLVARLDSDDYSKAERLEKQYKFMMAHPDIDLLGSYICEFFDNKDIIVYIRKVPIKHEEIVKRIWFLNPINHVTVMYKKQSVISAGMYNPFYGDDDYLWAKMWVNGARFHNLPECLVRVRIGDEMYRRRGGIKIFLWDIKMRWFLLQKRKINLCQFICAFFFYLIIRILTPLHLRKLLYKMARRKI